MFDTVSLVSWKGMNSNTLVSSKGEVCCPDWCDSVGHVPQTERLPVWFLVRGHAWIVSSVPSRAV